MLLQVVLIVLLPLSIGWSALLHRRLASLRQDGGGIARFVDDLVAATARAEVVVRDMRNQAQDLGRQWQRQRADSEAAFAELRQLVLQAEGRMQQLRRESPLPIDLPVDSQGVPSTGKRPPARSDNNSPGPSSHERIREAVRALR
ncbi:DUF6468 domain-containing protein [Geminicoccus roseus]|uniref:DUF6468 domain-containing protein n=1 Tax=Geminicoccus roseus TaxID=404900 RepID=UPI000408ACDE|nr:DUF6468 domain-containing protein [Geminicoccus roseus]